MKKLTVVRRLIARGMIGNKTHHFIKNKNKNIDFLD